MAASRQGPPITLRPARVDDIAAIHVIECASFGDPWSAASFRSMLGQAQVIATVAEMEDEVVGYSVAWQLADEAELANLAVAPSRRGAGIGGALVDDLLRTVETRGGATVYLEVRASNLAALALYRSRGFREVGRRAKYYERPTEDALVLRREPGAPPRGR